MRQRRSQASRRRVGVCRCAIEPPLRIRPFETAMWGRGGGRNLYKPVLRARAAVTRRGEGSLRPEHPRSGLTAARGSGMPTMRLRPPVNYRLTCVVGVAWLVLRSVLED